MTGTPALQGWRPGTREGQPCEAETTAEGPSAEAGLRERGVERDTLFRALKHVQSHGGSPGRAGMPVEERASELKEHGPRVKQVLWAGTLPPQPVPRVEVPNPQGGVRNLGGPTVVDRFRQPAVLQVLQAHGEPTVSEARFGCRPGRNAHQAVKRAAAYRQEGYPWVVEMDVEPFVARVNHDQVMSEVSTRVQDGRVLPLIHRLLKAGAMEHEARHEPGDRGPQGRPLSPFLCTLILDRLDREVERRGPRFVCYADDRHVDGRSPRAGDRG
jgi:RNA-directed DNA polymerase